MTASNSEPGGYVGLDMTDVAAGYRHHAARIADGLERRPYCVAMVELHADGQHLVLPLGMGDDPRGRISLLAECAGALAQAIQRMNAEAGN